MKEKFKLEGLDCANCAMKVETAVSKLSGVKDASVVFATKTLFVETNAEQTVSPEKLQALVKQVDGVIKVIPIALKNRGLSNKSNFKTIAAQVKSQEHNHHHEEHSHDACGCGHSHAEEHNHDDHSHDACGCGHSHTEVHSHDSCSCDVHEEAQTVAVLENAKSFTIAGLDCASCAMKVEKALQALPMMQQAVINFSTETLQVKTNTEIDAEALLQTIQKTVNKVEDGVTVSYKEAIRVLEKPKLFSLKTNWDLSLGLLLFIAAIALDNTMSTYLYLLSYILSGYKVLLKAFRNILRLDVFDENFLMCIATIGAFILGDYKEAVAVMLFYSVGEIFQSFAVNKTRSSISSLMDIKSEYANVMLNGNIKKVAAEEVQVGDVVVVKVGEKVPLDGIVLTGQSTLDTSSLTGESMPRNVAVDDQVLAGVVNLSEVLHVQVTTPYADSTVSKILELMENAASKKAPIEKFITRFARVYTPTVVVLAILLTVIPMLMFEDAVLYDWLYRSLTFLVVSCPCALVISIPLGLYAGLGKASKLGVLIKGGNYLELLKDIDTIVFDKTGTLTKGTFSVVEINGEPDVLEYAAHGEFLSNHPIAKSIVSSYNKEIKQSRITDFKEIAGKGISVTIDGVPMLLGNATFFAENKISYTEPKTIGTIIHVAYNKQYKGNIVVADTIKESSLSGIQKLKQAGIKETVMLTGDHHKTANAIADTLGIDKVLSELLPQDKVQEVENLMQQQNGKLAFVGDGINDAPVLARADIGIAMGGIGSDAAIEAADIVLMQDDLESIAEAITVSKKTDHILRQNVTFTLVIKIGVLLLTMVGLSNMWMGVFADVGVTLLAILNAMRVLK